MRCSSHALIIMTSEMYIEVIKTVALTSTTFSERKYWLISSQACQALLG